MLFNYVFAQFGICILNLIIHFLSGSSLVECKNIVIACTDFLRESMCSAMVRESITLRNIQCTHTSVECGETRVKCNVYTTQLNLKQAGKQDP